jgi:hypothetical protein
MGRCFISGKCLVRTGTEDSGEIRPHAPTFPNEQFSAHTGHRLVRNQQVEPLRCDTKRFPGLGCVPSHDQKVSERLQHLTSQPGKRLLIIDEQDALVSVGERFVSCRNRSSARR